MEEILMGAMKTPTPDQIIATNVRRFRTSKGWSQKHLGQLLGAPKTLVMDYEGRRSGRSQRPFRWSDLIAIAIALEITLYQLVSPQEAGTPIDLEAMSSWDQPLTMQRAAFGQLLFGISGDDLVDGILLRRFGESTATEATRRNEIVDQMVENLEEALRKLAARA
jgi:transcriptional regulator with XRE-family HTH domain